jgi:hypothetical protein
MLKSVLAAAFAAVLISAPLASVGAATAEKKVTPQQQKMKDCGAKWQEHKKTANVKGQAEYRKFLSGCLKG